MVVFLLMIALTGFGASLLPFLFPGSLVSLLGVNLNHMLGGLLASILQVDTGTLVERAGDGHALTFPGVLVVYLPILVALAFILRGR
jgi:hypothetical protein